MEQPELPSFSLSDGDAETRLKQLDAARAGALERTLAGLGPAGEASEMAYFCLPLAEWGLPAEIMLRMVRKVPPGYPLDHREMFFDFRLDRWIKHLEPPTLTQVLDEYVRTAGTPAQGLAYAREQWQAFLRRHDAAP